MLHLSLQSTNETIGCDNIQLVYKLIFKNALYSLECFKASNKENKSQCYIEGFTDDEGEAEFFLKRMVKGKVLPIHIKDMVEDYFH